VAPCLLPSLTAQDEAPDTSWLLNHDRGEYEKGVWRGHAIINWDKGKFDLHDEVCFPTEMEAEEHAVELAKHWVNNHLQRMQGSS